MLLLDVITIYYTLYWQIMDNNGYYWYLFNSNHKLMIDSLFIPQSLRIKHQQLSSRFNSKHQILINEIPSSPIKQQIIQILLIKVLKILDGNSGCFYSSKWSNFLIYNLLGFRNELHFCYESISQFCVCVLKLVKNVRDRKLDMSRLPWYPSQTGIELFPQIILVVRVLRISVNGRLYRCWVSRR